MIYKGFFRKKSSKLYLIIYSLLFIGISILIVCRDYYINKENSIHINDFLLVENKNNVDLNKIHNIESSKKAIYINDLQEIVLLISDNVKDNEAIISDFFAVDVMDNSFIKIVYANKSFELKIKEISKDLKMHCIFISKDFFDKLEEEKTSYYYTLNLKNWLKLEKTTDNLRKNFNISSAFYINSSEDDFKDIFNIITIFLMLFIFIFLIVAIITTFNIIDDERNNNKLYKLLGYQKSRILLITTCKLILIILAALLLAIVISQSIKFIIFK